MTPPPGRSGSDALGPRLGQAAMAIVPTLLSVALMVTTHRLRLEVLGIDWPVGLVLGAVYQSVTAVFLHAVTGSRLPLVVLGSLWGLLVLPFAGRGPGGGVLMPAVIGEQTQYSGWIVQALGVFIPFLVALVITVGRRRRDRRDARGPCRAEAPAR